jgi:hypothetical protein
MATMLEKFLTEEQHSVVNFLWAKGLNAKNIHKDVLPVYDRSVCRVKRFTTGLRNSLKDVRKSQMMPNHVALLGVQQKQLCRRWKSLFSLTGR